MLLKCHKAPTSSYEVSLFFFIGDIIIFHIKYKIKTGKESREEEDEEG
jgi:hypothetical protein